MKTKNLLLVIWAVATLAAPSLARSQERGGDAVARTVSWLTGDMAALNGPSCDTGPKCYAEDVSCSTGACGQCADCCQSYDVWGSVELLMWWGKGTGLPPLVTTSLPGTPQVDAGVLGVPGTSILFGDQIAGQKMQGGGRFTAGMWLDPDHDIAAGGRFFGLGGDTTRFSQSSNGNSILARPFFNALLNTPDAFLVGFPGLSSGNITAHLTTNNILGAEAFTEIMMLVDANRRIDLVVGYQFFRMNDWLQIDSASTFTDPNNPLVGTLVEISDRFSTSNQFHGGEVGLKGRLARGQWSIDALAKVGIGNMRQSVTIAGSNAITPAGGGAPLVGTSGLLAQASNIGTFERDKFAFIPELTFNLKYHINPCLSTHIGYNIMWLSDVALSGDQIDTTADLAQIVAPPRPQFAFRDQEYWLQGINLGVNLDF